MLTAKTKSGEKICLGLFYEKETLLTLRKKEEFICPVCGEEVCLKLGDQRIFHFAHKREGSCRGDFEGESIYHMDGKRQLYQWLLRQKIPSELEYYDKEIQQRPDVMFIYNGKKFALEYQCSAITEKNFVKRTNAYLANGYIPLWILGHNQIQEKKKNILSLSNFHYLFVQKTSSGSFYIPSYCSEKRHFHLFGSIHPYSIKNAVTEHYQIPKDSLWLDGIIHPQLTNSINIEKWNHELEKFYWHWSLHPGPQNRPFFHEIYKHNLNPFLLPPEIGIPVQRSILIQSHPIIWQTYFFIDAVLNKQPGDVFSTFEVANKFQWRIKRKEIYIRRLCLVSNMNPLDAVVDYMILLEKLGLLSREGDHLFRIQKQLYIPMSNREMEERKRDFQQKNHMILTKR